jgi:hypothetical protein
MSIGTRAAACSSCGKRLTRKSWFYRNGKYYCKRRCFETEAAKAAKEAATKAKEAKESGAADAPAEKPAEAKAE